MLHYLKRSSTLSSSLFKFWQIFWDYEKDNHEELENAIGLIREDFFWTFSRKKNFWKNHHFYWFLAIMQHSQNTAENMIFVPDVRNFCAFCVHVRCAPTCGSYSPKHGDVPRYPNLAKIPKIRRCSSLWSRVIFLFEEKKI